ncbi:MAG: NCS2 family permease [Verrucomicrobiae bacterium]|nr:NCS2 family permease [Verrucomicrobiae bacterium]
MTAGLGNASPASIRTEIQGGIAIFLAIAYIVVIEPAVLSGQAVGMTTGIPAGAAFTATCLAAAVSCFLMGAIGRLPIAAAPYMGENFFFVTALIPAAAAAGYPEPWRAALATTLLAATLLLVVSATGLRRLLAGGIPSSLVHAIGAGIGLFITFLGLKAAGVVVADPANGVGFTRHPLSPDLLVALAGLVTTVALHARGVRSAVIAGIALTFALGAGTRMLLPHLPAAIADSTAVTASRTLGSLHWPATIVSMPPSPAPLLLGLDWTALVDARLLPGALVLFLMILFDATGTLLAVLGVLAPAEGQEPGTSDPRFRRGLLADALGSVAAPLLGTSAVGAYMESTVAGPIGARRGLSAMVVGVLFLLAMPLAPLVASFGSYPPATAPALILVGALLAGGVRRIPWDDATEAVPALATVAGIPLTFSIAHGIAFGFVLWPLMKAAAGRRREVRSVAWILGILAAASLVLQ